MRDLDSASRRLKDALARLDEAVAGRLAVAAPAQAPAPGDGAGRPTDVAALQAAEGEAQELRDLGGEVARRLDAAIARLDRVLGE